MFIVNKTMYFSRVSVCLQTLTLVLVCAGLWVMTEQPLTLGSSTGRISVQVHQMIYVTENKAPYTLRVTASGVTQTIERNQANETFHFESVPYLGGILFRVMEGPHPRSCLVLTPSEFVRGPHAYRISDLHIAVMSLSWVKDARQVRL